MYICVDPDSQRRGIGSELIQRAFQRAKAYDLPLATCAEPASYGFFAKLGFKDTTHGDIELQKFAPAYSGFGVFRLTGMIWYP